MKKNYLSMEYIAEVLKKEMVQYYLDFNANDDFEFTKCEGWDGPLLDHQEVKCPVKEGVRYTPDVVKSFENWRKRIPGFREQLKSRQQIEKNLRAVAISDYVKIALESAETKNRPGGVSQLAKPRLPPLWSGQKYDRWKIEVEKWSDNNKLSDEEKFIDLLESLKKNDEVRTVCSEYPDRESWKDMNSEENA